MTLYLLFFAIYVVIVVAIGVISSRKEDEEDFMIARRKLHGAQLAATMTAGFFDSAALAIYIAYIYQYGFSAIWLFIGVVAGFLWLRRFVGRIKAKADAMHAYSMPEYFYKVLGKRNGLMFSIFLVIQFFIFLIVNFIIAGKVFTAIFGVPYYWSVIIGALIVLTYLLMAGFKAVIRTDFFQLAITFIMSLTIGLFLLGKAHIPVSEINLTTLGTGNIIAFVLLGLLSVMVAPDLWQRMFASRDEKTLKRGLWYSSVALIAAALIMSVLGLVTKQLLPHIAPEDALVTGFSTLLPYGLKAFGMVLLYAVCLSSSDTVIFVLSAIFTRDLKNYTKKYSEESMKRLARFFMVVMVVVAILVAIAYQNVVSLGLSFASLNLALFPIVFGTLYWKLKENAVFWTLILSLASVAILFALNLFTPENSVIVLPIALFSLLIFSKIFKRRAVSAEFLAS